MQRPILCCGNGGVSPPGSATERSADSGRVLTVYFEDYDQPYLPSLIDDVRAITSP
jgi:hypothetical protein